MTDWKCPNCGHVLGQINLIAGANAAAAAPAMVTMTYGICGDCGKPLPPITAAAHQCWPSMR